MDRRAYLGATAAALSGCATVALTGHMVGSDGTGTVGDSTDESRSTPVVASPGTFDDFGELSRWEVLEGSITATADRTFRGSQAVRIDVAASEKRAAIARAFDRPLDLSGVVPGVALAAEEMTVPWLHAFDADGDRITYRAAFKGGLPFRRNNFGVVDVAGDPDLSAVTELRLVVWSGEGNRHRVWVDDLHFVPRPDTGKVMLQFDDNHVTDYTTALPVLEEYGYPAVAFVNPGRIEAEMAGVEDPGGFPRVTLD